MMARRALFTTFAVLGTFAACDESEDYSKSRLIDRVCTESQCRLEGSARQVSGLTPDSLGFEIGPEPGVVVFPLSAELAPEFSSYGVDVLIQGEGSTSTGPLTPNYAWRRADTSDSMDSQPESAKVVIDSGSHATIADLRLVDLSDYGNLCSVRAPGWRRGRGQH